VDLECSKTESRAEALAIPALVLAAAACYWAWVLWPYYTIPSQDDGLNHLLYVQLLAKARTWTLGYVSYPHSEEFGLETLNFYPAGMHVLLAPFAGFIELGLLLKAFAIVVLALLPVFTFKGIRRLEPELNRGTAALLAASSATLLIFPAAPLGEGGLPRIAAHVFALPFVFAAVSGAMSFAMFLLSAAILTPALFYIHPSSFFVLYPALLFFTRPSDGLRSPLRLTGMVLSGLAGAALCVIPTKTGPFPVSAMGIAGEFQFPTLWSVYDRFKGVFHFLFSDPHGWLKFMSIRSWAAYLGIAALFRNSARRRQLWLLGVPFLLSLSSLAPTGVLQTPGGLFYQSVKRISEVGFVPLVICSAAGLRWIESRRTRIARIVMVVLLSVWIVVSGVKSRQTVQHMADLFQTPRMSEVSEFRHRLEPVPAGSVIVSSQQWFMVTLGIRPDLLYVGAEGECRNREVPACVGRIRFIEEVAASAGAERVEAPFQTPHFAGRELYYVHRTVGEVRTGLDIRLVRGGRSSNL
jgi:hypothetical protein